MNNQILNGDCIEIMQKMENNSINLILTDPPYNLFKHKIERKVNINDFMTEAHRILKDNSFLIYFGMQPSLTKWNLAAMKYFRYKNELIWYKRNNTCVYSDMLRVYENIMIFQKGIRKFNDVRRPYSDVKQSLSEFVETNTFKRAISDMKQIHKKNAIIEKFKKDGTSPITQSYYNDCLNFRKNNMKKNRLISSYEMFTKGCRPQNLVSFQPHNKQRYNSKEFNVQHPTTKPINLIEYLILLSSNENDLIFDGFLGSGTTAIACLRTNRSYIGVEIDAGYYDIANNRLQNEYEKLNERLL